MKVVVTGGSGFVGKRLQLVKPDWVYLSSKDYNLMDSGDCDRMYKELQPDAVVHLAGQVGGIKANDDRPADFYYMNITMNTNIVQKAYENGVERVLASLSTCTFPDVVKRYPLTEEDIFDGPPAATNISYGYAKRSLLIQILAYRRQYGLNYSSFCPSNLYGPGDNFDLNTSHFVPAMIRKFSEASDGDTIEVWGTGKPLRQQLYVDDLANIIPILLDKHHTEVPLIVAPSENLSISEMVSMIKEKSGKNCEVFYNNNLDGQFRKDGSNKKLIDLIGEYNFINFKDGVEQTYDWYANKVL
jgi:GDP-L-fucose synthase